MDGECNRECLTFANPCKQELIVNTNETFTNTSVEESSLANHTQAIPIGGSSLHFGNILSMAASNAPSNISNLPEQVLLTLQPMGGNIVEVSEDGKDLSHSLAVAAIANANATKLNGTTQLVNGNVQTMVNLQGLSAIPVPQLSTLSIPGLTGLGTINQYTTSPPQSMNAITHATTAGPPQSVGMPQFILAGGQLMQGIQGAQLLIPTSSGVATQQILTIPVNQVPPGQQLMQIMTPSGQIVTTSLNGLQALTSPQAANANSLQPQTVITSNIQSLGQNQMLPQIITNSAGQILAVSPQIIGQSSLSPGVVQVFGGAPHMHGDKQQALHTNGHVTLTGAKAALTAGPTGLLPTQTHIQIATVNDTSQIASHTVQRTTTTPNQIIQVAQTSSPSITSTESSTPISQTSANTVDGINLEEIKEFAKAFKIRRLSLGLTQTQVGQALSVTEGPAYSQSAICRFEKLDITPKSAQKIKPVLERWMKEAEERYKTGAHNLTEFIGTEPSKKRKRRTSFTPQALEVLNQQFEKNTHPSGAEMTDLAEVLKYDREVVRVWFCNKRQTLKNTVKRLKTVCT